MSSTNKEYLLGWKDHGKNFSLEFADLLQDDKLVDVQLVAEGHLISAHRLVLAAVSPYFCNMFSQMPANQQAFVFLKDISKKTVTDLITYIYRGEVNVKQDSLDEFMGAAQALNIKGLADGSYSQLFDSRPSYSTSAGPLSSGSVFQTPNFGSTGVQYQSVQRSAQLTQYSQSKEEYQHKNGFNFDNSNEMNDFFSNCEQSYYDDNTNNDFAMTETNEFNAGFDDIQRENTAPKPSTRCIGLNTSEYDIVAKIQDKNGREILLHNNYTFGKHGKPNAYGTQRWRCGKQSKKCRAAMSTMDINGVTMMKTLIDEHNHTSTD